MFGIPKLYAALALGAILLVALGASFASGYNHGKKVQLGEDHTKLVNASSKLKESGSHLRDAAVALSAAGKAIGAVAAEASRRAEEAAQDKREAEAGAALAAAAVVDLRRSVGDYQARLARARGRSASCAALLDFDIDAELAKAGCTP